MWYILFKELKIFISFVLLPICFSNFKGKLLKSSRIKLIRLTFYDLEYTIMLNNKKKNEVKIANKCRHIFSKKVINLKF